MQFVDPWEWKNSFYQRALWQGDKERVELVQIYDRAYQKFESNPVEARVLLEQGHSLADLLNEPHWKLFYRHWLYNVIMYYQGNFAEGIAIALKNAVEVRKPEYRHWPFLCRVYRAATDAFLIADPVGYADRITEAIDYIETQLPLDVDTWQILLETRTYLMLGLDRWDEALKLAERYLARSESSTFRRIYACELLCIIHHHFAQDKEVVQFAELGERSARSRNYDVQLRLASFLLWQAYGRRADSEKAMQLFRSANQAIARIKAPLDTSYYDALSAFYVATGQYAEALAARNRDLTEILERGSPHQECLARLSRCKILKLMGLLMPVDLEAARGASQKLIAPASFLAKLDALQQNNVDFNVS
jgi:hypothetical protein